MWVCIFQLTIAIALTHSNVPLGVAAGSADEDLAGAEGIATGDHICFIPGHGFMQAQNLYTACMANAVRYSQPWCAKNIQHS